MTHKITEGLELTDEQAGVSYGIPVLVANGIALGKSDCLPEPFCAAGYDTSGNHTGRGEDKCKLAGVLVKNYASSILNMDEKTFNFIKRFYA